MTVESKKKAGGDKNSPDGSESSHPDVHVKKPMMVSRGESGVLLWFSFQRGFGFVKIDSSGKDLFVHRNEFLRDSLGEIFYRLGRGYKLEFDIVRRSRGLEAVAVTGAGGKKVAGTRALPKRQLEGTDNEANGKKIEVAEEENPVDKTQKNESQKPAKKSRRGSRNRKKPPLSDASKESDSSGEQDPIKKAFFEKVRRSILLDVGGIGGDEVEEKKPEKQVNSAGGDGGAKEKRKRQRKATKKLPFEDVPRKDAVEQKKKDDTPKRQQQKKASAETKKSALSENSDS